MHIEKHHHQYAYLSMEGPCKYATFTLSDVWCKVKAMVEIHDLFPTARAYLYIDSDAIITTDYSMTNVIGYIQQDLHWNITQKPIAFNQDGPGWSCKYTMQLGYTYCLNSGTIFWYNLHDITRSIFSEWLNSASDSYDTSLFPSKWRTKWPYEQAQMYKIYDMYEDKIIRLSFPDRAYLPWTSYKNPKAQYPTDKVEPWCFCHMPGTLKHCLMLSNKLIYYRILMFMICICICTQGPTALYLITVRAFARKSASYRYSQT